MRLRAPHGLRFLTAALALAICLAAPVATAQRLTPAALVATVAKAEDRTSAGDWSAAAVLWAQLTKANPTNGHFWIRLGGARLKSKDYAGAVPAFEKAIELGAGAPERSMYAIASAYAQLGQTDAALTWLEKAMKAGWSNLTELRTDPALAAVRQDPRFQALTPMRPTGALSPEEGWRSDLRLLSWQMERVGAAPYRRRPKA